MSIRLRSARRNKYGVRIDAAGKAARTVDGILFDSLLERRRYDELKWLERAGEIWGLRVHPRYELIVNGKVIGDYEPDFTYDERYGNGKYSFVVEDVKGTWTDFAKWKVRHFEAQYRMPVRIITKADVRRAA